MKMIYLNVKKLAFLSIFIAFTAKGELIFEDSFVEFDINKPLVVQDFADGMSGGMVSRGRDAIKRAGERVARAIERQGFHNSQRRRERMERAARAGGANIPKPSKVYLRGGRYSRFL